VRVWLQKRGFDPASVRLGTAIRVPLLPGASHFFDPHEVWRGHGRADFTLWHRLMLFGGFLLRYATRR